MFLQGERLMPYLQSRPLALFLRDAQFTDVLPDNIPFSMDDLDVAIHFCSLFFHRRYHACVRHDLFSLS